MNITRDYSSDTPRADVICELAELTAGEDSTYTFTDTTLPGKLGAGTSVIVLDSPGLLLFLGSDDVLHPW